MCKKILLSVVCVLALARVSFASDHLFYFEAQAVGGYSSGEDKWVDYSLNREEVMQRPSVGFDYLQKFSGETGDYGSLAIQARLAHNSSREDNFEPQLYNAYYRHKTLLGDVWVGHARPALGLSSYFDTHGLLIQTLSMQGFGFDRDWGVGAYRDLPWGNAAFSLTTGTGMNIRTQGNYLASGRVSKGVLAQENYNLGFTLSYGETLEAMGYTIMDGDPKEYAMAGADFTYLFQNYESRMEVMGGKNRGEDAYALFWRLGVNLLEEGRLKYEVQPVYLKVGDKKNFQVHTGPSYALTADLALRAMYLYDDRIGERDDHRFIVQLYFYKGL
jgi:hypothetical protein